MRTYKILVIVAAVLLVGVGFGLWYYFSKVGADTLPVVKSTTVQVVDSNGQEIKASIPLELQIRVRILQCERMSILFRRLGGGGNGKVCKTRPGTIIKTVKTDANGSIVISDKLLSKVNSKEILDNAKDDIESDLNTKLNNEELQRLQNIVNYVMSGSANQNEANSEVSYLFSSVMTRNGSSSQAINYMMSPSSDFVHSVLGRLFSSSSHSKDTDKILSLSGDKIIESVSIKVDSKALKSDTLNVSFLESEYKEKASLIVYAGNLADLQKDSATYLDQYAKENNLSVGQKEQYSNFLNGFFDYEMTQAINSLGSSEDKLKSVLKPISD